MAPRKTPVLWEFLRLVMACYGDGNPVGCPGSVLPFPLSSFSPHPSCFLSFFALSLSISSFSFSSFFLPSLLPFLSLSSLCLCEERQMCILVVMMERWLKDSLERKNRYLHLPRSLAWELGREPGSENKDGSLQRWEARRVVDVIHGGSLAVMWLWEKVGEWP